MNHRNLLVFTQRACKYLVIPSKLTIPSVMKLCVFSRSSPWLLDLNPVKCLESSKSSCESAAVVLCITCKLFRGQALRSLSEHREYYGVCLYMGVLMGLCLFLVEPSIHSK